MSDPLSMAASIAGLAALTAQVFKTMIDYGKAVKDARMDVGILTTELRTLSGMLTNLSLLATSLEASTSSNNFFSDFQLDHLKRTVKNMDVELARARSNFEANRFISVVQKLKWPFSKDDMMKLVEEIRALKATVNLALSADTLETLIQCLSAQEDMRVEVASTRDAVKVLQEMYLRVELNQERQKTYDYFLKINPQTQFEMTQQLRNIHTGGWFIKHGSVSEWMLQSNSRLWSTGIAGSGKTLLCGLLIERVLEICNADTVLAFFFCDYKDLETQVLSNILSSIALQIALQKPEAFNKLQKYYNELNPASGLPRQVDVGKLTDTIADMCQLFSKVFLIVDGLDECIDNTRENTRGLCQLARSIPNLSIAVFSRKEVEISSELVPEYSEMEISAQDQDLELYIDAEMTKRPTLCGLPMEERDRIKETLISKAKGMFRWVTCQLDCLEGLGRIGRETALNELPPTLDESYDRILTKVMSKKGRNIAQEIVRNTLHWVCYDSPGLNIAQICEALSIALNRDRKGACKPDLVDEKEIMTYCSSLIRKNLDGDKFELAHFTVEEYLKGIDDESKLRSFKYSKADAERSLAQVSLEQIMSPSFASRPVAEMSEYKKSMQRHMDYPFYTYAASHWSTVPGTHDDAAVSKLIRDLFTARKRPYLQNWLIHLCMGFAKPSVAEPMGDNTRNEVTYLITLILRGDLTPLHIAAMIHSSSLCRWLLSKDINVNATTFSDLAPIHFALLGLDAFRVSQKPLVEYSFWSIKAGLPSSDDLHETINTLLDHDLKVPAVNRGSVGKLALDVCGRYSDGGPFCTLLALFPEDCLAQDALDRIQAMFQYQTLKHTVVHDVVQAIFNLDAGVDKKAQIVRALQFVSELVRSDGSWDTYDHDGDQFLPVLIKDADFLKYVWYTAAQDRAEDMTRLLDDIRFKDHFNPTKDINSRYNPLFAAGAHDSAKVVGVLLQSGYDWLGVDQRGDTVWHVAARMDSVHVLQTLLDLHGDIERCLRAVLHGNTPVGDAMSNRRNKAATLLIGHCTDDPAFFRCQSNILGCAVAMGSQSLFHQLVSKGVSVDTSGSIPPLHLVNNHCSDDFIEELVQLDDKDHVSQTGTTAFQEYIRVTLLMVDLTPLTDEQVTSRLRILAPTNHVHHETGSEYHIWRLFCKDLGTYGNQPRTATEIHNINKLLMGLTNAGVTKSFETQDRGSSMTALFEELEVLNFNAGFYRWEDSVLKCAYFLLQPPPDVMHHRSAIAFLTKAVRQGHHPTVRWLLGLNTPVHIRVNSIAPLEQACQAGSFQTFVEVFQACDRSLVDGFDLLCRLIDTAAQIPAGDVHTMKKIRFGLDHGLSVDKKVTSGHTPGYPAIVLAARLGRYDIVDLLMIRGADVFAQAPDRWDLTKYSIHQNRVHLFRQLLERSRSISGYDWKACVTFKPTPLSPKKSLDDDDFSVLHVAAVGGAAEIIDHLFSNDLVENVDRCTKGFITPLQIACSTGNVPTIRCLLRHGANINGVNTKHSRPIEIALMYNHNDAVVILRSLGAESSLSTGRVSKDSIAWSQAVKCCIEDGDLNRLQALSLESRLVDFRLPTCGFCDTLTYAITRCQSDIVTWLLFKGVIPRQDVCYQHAILGVLHLAVTKPITDLCLHLLLDKTLEHGYAWTSNPTNPLHLACLYGDVDRLKYILNYLEANAKRYCASVSPWKDRKVPPSKAAMVTALTGARTGPNKGLLIPWYSYNATALHIAVVYNNLPVSMALVNAGADVNSFDDKVQTPLIVAVISSKDNCELVEFLLDHGALIDHKDENEYSALAHAARMDFIQVARLLVQRGASLKTRNGSSSDLMRISSKYSVRCFIYFRQQGCDGEFTLDENAICRRGDPRVFIYLLNARPELDTDSESALELISLTLLKFGTKVARMFYRSLPKDVRQSLLSSDRDNPPYLSPLSTAMSVERLHNALPWLLDEGSDFEREISDGGTAILYACFLGYLALVKMLVRRGARLDYIDTKGRYRSAILAARQYPNIIRWLLVERFQDQPKLVWVTH